MKCILKVAVLSIRLKLVKKIMKILKNPSSKRRRGTQQRERYFELQHVGKKLSSSVGLFATTCGAMVHIVPSPSMRERVEQRGKECRVVKCQSDKGEWEGCVCICVIMRVRLPYDMHSNVTTTRSRLRLVGRLDLVCWWTMNR